jgi:Protein of unknown function (DUF551)
MPNWIKTTDSLPESDFPVLIYATMPDSPDYARRLRAIYARRYTLETAQDDDFGEYNDDVDKTYAPAGWYLCNESDMTHWILEGIVTHWMYLPDPPVKHNCEQIKDYDNITNLMNWKK